MDTTPDRPVTTTPDPPHEPATAEVDPSEPAGSGRADETGRADEAAQEDEGADGGPSWWHRDHPTFTALSGFFAGLLFLILVPGVYGAVLNAVVAYDTAERLFPYVLVALLVPAVLLVVPRTRRFGRYMALGMVSTAVVVLGVGGLVLWILVARG